MLISYFQALHSYFQEKKNIWRRLQYLVFIIPLTQLNRKHLWKRMNALTFYSMLSAHQFDFPESALFMFLHRDYSSGPSFVTL